MLAIALGATAALLVPLAVLLCVRQRNRRRGRALRAELVGETRKIDLPSGIVCTIKAPGALTYHAVFEALPVLAGGDESEVPLRKELPQFLDLISRCCIDPQFVTKFPEQCKGRERSFDELTLTDLAVLSGEVLRLGGLVRKDRLGPFARTPGP